MSTAMAKQGTGAAQQRTLRRDLAAIRRRGFGIALFVLSAIVLLLFARGTAPGEVSVFQFTAPPAFPVPHRPDFGR